MEAVSLSQSSLLRRKRDWLSVLWALASGALLRAWMLHKFFEVTGDSQLYGNIAKNLLHHRYAISDNSGVLHSTLIRLPGYPLFLAICFKLLGVDRYGPAVCVQIVLELAGCLLLALFAARISPSRFKTAAAHGALWLAALCPFTAVYAAEPLTEALTLFCITLALWSAARFSDKLDWTSALVFTAAATYAALLRPDGALVGIAFAPALGFAIVRRGTRQNGAHLLRMAMTCVLLASSPFALWTVRNYSVFHVVQPLAPRYASDPGEDTWPGWQHWVKTWSLDFVSTYSIYWNIPDAPFDIKQLPDRAFDSPGQREEVAALADRYEADGEQLSPQLDTHFEALAEQRVAAHPLRYYVELPLGRVADMLLRPRVENLPIDLDWWVYAHHNQETRISWAYAGLNAIYLLLGIVGLCLRPRLWPYMLAYFLLRCALLSTIEAPEARYTLEFFPMIFVLGGVALSRVFTRRAKSSA